MKNDKLPALIFTILISATFYVWYLHAYYQPINPDVYDSIVETHEDLRFPEMLIAKDKLFHARWFAQVLIHGSFHSVGTVYSSLTGNKVESFFVAQGFASAISYVLMALLSAYYISLCSAFLSSRYLFSYVIVLPFLLIGHNIYLSGLHGAPFIFTFYHPTIMANYVWCFDILLAFFLPYWRYYLTSNWDDWYNNKYLAVFWSVSIFMCAFSTNCITLISLYLSALIIFCISTYNFFSNKLAGNFFSRLWASLPGIGYKIYYGLYLMIFLCVVALVSEQSGQYIHSTSSIFSSGTPPIRIFKNYCFLWYEFITQTAYLRAFAGAGLTILLLSTTLIKIKSDSSKKMIIKLLYVYTFLLFTALSYGFIIGMGQIENRYKGTNLGGDTLFYLSWTLMFIMLSSLVFLVTSTRIKILASLFIFIALTHVVHSLTGNPHFEKQKQENAFNLISRLDKLNLPGPILFPQSYSNEVNPQWHGGTKSTLSRLSKFANETGLTKTEKEFQIVEDSVFINAYSKYYPQIQTEIERY